MSSKAQTKNDSLYDTAHGELAAAKTSLRNAKRMIEFLTNPPERLVRFNISEALAQIELLAQVLDLSQQDEHHNGQGQV
jgi:hypothetical protein